MNKLQVNKLEINIEEIVRMLKEMELAYNSDTSFTGGIKIPTNFVYSEDDSKYSFEEVKEVFLTKQDLSKELSDWLERDNWNEKVAYFIYNDMTNKCKDRIYINDIFVLNNENEYIIKFTMDNSYQGMRVEPKINRDHCKYVCCGCCKI